MNPPIYLPTYTFDPDHIPGDLVSYVRLLVGDTDLSVTEGIGATVIFSDQILMAFVTIAPYQDPYYAASAALRSHARKLTLDASMVSIGEFRVDITKKATMLLKLADDLDETNANQPAEMTAEVDWNAFTQRRLLRNQAIRRSVF